VQSLACAILVWEATPSVEARSLAKQIDEFSGPSGILLDVGDSPGGGSLHSTQFTSSSLATLGVMVKMLSANAVEVPAISTAPDQTFRYDSDTQLFERSTTFLGPVFVERALICFVTFFFPLNDDGRGLTGFQLPAWSTTSIMFSYTQFRLKGARV
jgi:hypothetical protein